MSHKWYQQKNKNSKHRLGKTMQIMCSIEDFYSKYITNYKLQLSNKDTTEILKWRKYLNRHFLKVDRQESNKHMTRFSTSLDV